VHEVGLCQGILEAVQRRAAGRRVTRVRIRVGARHRVVSPALDQAFALVSQGTVADGAAVDLVVVPIQVRCLDCGDQAETTDTLAACPACGGLDLETSGGDELILEAIRVEEQDVSGHPG
jgi:hydrogenase nickel incorporation protein HypA/HybF